MQAVYEAAEARRSSARFEEMANRDALTGLFNRRWVDDRLSALVTAARRGGEPLSVALVDLDHFKRINDTLSHAAGDVVLRRVGALLDGFATGSESPARLGGEEFVLLLPGLGGQAAEQRCETLAALLRQTDWTAVTGALPVTASIGVTTYTGGPVTPAALLARADEQLYAAKRAGRDRVVMG
jgi:diguanylate cyclase (GGDEF)-like protein